MRKLLISSFITLHLSAISWWLIPSDGYPNSERVAAVPAWLSNSENQLFQLKKDSQSTRLAEVFRTYIFTTALWQKWWMFGPNPPNQFKYMSVYNLIGWSPADTVRDPSSSPLLGNWGDSRMPIYDPEPIYKSYEGSIADNLTQFAGTYSQGPKLTENLSSGKNKEGLRSFASYWARQAKRSGPSLGIHVVIHEFNVPIPFRETIKDLTPSQDRVIWYVHN